MTESEPDRKLDRTKLLAARFRAATDRPYLASALYSLTVVESQTVPTMAVDRHWRCYVSAEFVDRLPVAQLAAVWLHEVAHLLRDHHGRASLLPPGQRRDHHRVNVAQDAEINDDLLADGQPLPEERVDPARLGLPTGLLFEQYLPLLPAHIHSHDCGSAAHGVARPWDLPGSDAGSVSDVESQALRRSTAAAIRQAARGRGSVPDGWVRWADGVLEPVVDWRRALTGAIREAAAWAAGAVDYTYQRPSRRSAALRGVVLPRLRQPVPRVAVVVDTSGSMDSEALATALAEIGGVLRAVGIGGNRVTVLSCDAAVHVARRVSTVGEVVLAGGGGTDMRIGIDAAIAVPDPPAFVIVLSDGYTPWPDEQLVRTRVIAGVIGEGAPEPPPWITTIHIPA
ncbi:VWA-like domain-containing protein [Hamadaea sp. NPDC050747]|uniref:vWA domain-containing protein n=1 Tax=Hamadaea sp. NPDC050747 TaxID=3155789 RepID=UPI0033C9DC31